MRLSIFWPWILIILALIFALWARFSLVEAKELSFYCQAGGTGALCTLRWFIVKSFDTYGLGYLGVFLGILATVTRSDWVALGAATTGVAGLILYTWDFSALGFLLGILVLSRSTFNECGYQNRTRQQERYQGP